MTTDQKAALLTPEEQVICERVGATDEAPHNQRARALLALNEGLSQARAGEQAGLTPGQVKYCLSQFRQQRTGIFPEELQAQPVPAQPEKTAEPPAVADSQPVEETPAPSQVAEAAQEEQPKPKQRKEKKKSKDSKKDKDKKKKSKKGKKKKKKKGKK